MSESPHLGLGYLAPAQAQKHVTVNEALRRLDAIVQLGVLDRDRTEPPASPEEGDRHIVAADATGAWAGKTGRIAAFLDGIWVFIAPRPGWLAYVAAEEALLAFVGGVWTSWLGTLRTLGINASADDVNRLSASSDAVLFNHDGADMRLKLNKAAAADVASVLFQRGFSGRAEVGLAGSDAFSLKVSPDGGAWTTALEVDPATGAVALPATPRMRIDKFTADGTWTKPVWATRVVVELISGGSGGGSGAVRAAGGGASGGGGGAPSVMSAYDLAAADLPPTVDVAVGAGGTGGAAQASASANGLPGLVGGASTFGVYCRAQTTGPGLGGGAAMGTAGSVEASRFLPPVGGTLAGGQGTNGNGAAGASGPGRFAAGAGGGGGLSTANVSGLGGASGVNRMATAQSRATAGGASDGAPGADGLAAALTILAPGDSGGGGAGSATGDGGRGGDGFAPGGSGGGGGGARNGSTSGRGGDGARGEVWVWSYA